jgi:hypothetical protein
VDHQTVGRRVDGGVDRRPVHDGEGVGLDQLTGDRIGRGRCRAVGSGGCAAREDAAREDDERHGDGDDAGDTTCRPSPK